MSRPRTDADNSADGAILLIMPIRSHHRISVYMVPVGLKGVVPLYRDLYKSWLSGALQIATAVLSDAADVATTLSKAG